MEKGISIYYSPEDLAELHEFIQWKTNKAAGKFASVESNFDLREAADLIRQAKISKQRILADIERQHGNEEALAQQRENVSLLPDREAERIQSEWRERATAQAKNWAESRNRGATPRATQGVDPDIQLGVLSWIERQRRRGHLKKN